MIKYICDKCKKEYITFPEQQCVFSTLQNLFVAFIKFSVIRN